MKKSKFMSLVAILLMLVVALTCGFLFACNSDKDDDTKDQDIVDETPVDPTDPADPSEPGTSTEPSESGEESVVSAYEGTLAFGDSYTDEEGTQHDYYADFTNLDGLTLTAGTDDDGKTTYSFEGFVPRMTEEQVLAFNVGPDEDGTKDGATTSDGFVVIAIAAETGYTVDYAGVIEVVGEEGYVTFVQMVRNKGDKEVTIYGEDGAEADSFTIVLSGLIICDNALVGVWSNASISATAMETIDASAAVELVVYDDGTYSLYICNINALGLDLSSYDTEMEGTWLGGEGTYALTGEEGNSVTVTMNEDGESVEISFSMVYDFMGLMDIPIDVDGETLTAGRLASIVGTWSNVEITAQTKFIVDITATASAELEIEEDGTYTLVVSNISAGSLNLSGVEIEMTGTWTEGDEDMTYVLTGEEGNEVTIVLARNGNSVQMSFSIEYTVESLNMTLPITVTEETLYAGALEVEREAD